MSWSVFRLYRGASDVHRSWRARKGKKRGQIRVKILLFCLYFDTTNFSCLLSNFSRLKATILLLLIYDCIWDHVLTTTKSNHCFLLLRTLGKKLVSGTNVSYFLLPMELTWATWNRGTPTPISLTINNISPH